MAEIAFDISRLKLDEAGEKIVRAALAGMTQFGESVMTRSKAEFVPVDTGTLRSTGHVTPAVIENGDALVRLGFGGPGASYAVPVHENLMAKHPVGQAKYLEAPVLQMAPQMAPYVAKIIKAAL